MSAGFSLADIKNSVDEKFGPIPIDLGDGQTSMLLPSTRLGDTKMDELSDLVGKFNDLQSGAREMQSAASAAADGSVQQEALKNARQLKADAVETMENVFRIVARSDADAERLIAACNHDILVLAEVFKRYQEPTQLGESSASPATSETTAGPSSTTSSESTD